MRVAARVLVSVALIVIALAILDIQSLHRAIRETSLASLSVAVLLIIGSFVFLAFRWIRIAQPYVTSSVLEHMRVYFYASFLNSFTPANIAGDVYRAGTLKAKASSLAWLIVALLRERLFGLLSFFAGYGLCVILNGLLTPGGFKGVDPIFLVALAPICAGMLALMSGEFVLKRLTALRWVAERPKLGSTVEKIAAAMVLRDRREFAFLLALSLVALAAWIAAVGVISRDLNMALSLPMLGAIAILTELVRLVPITLQGIGLREGAFSVLVGLAGGSPETGFLLGTWSYLALSVALLSCGPIALGLESIARRRPS